MGQKRKSSRNVRRTWERYRNQQDQPREKMAASRRTSTRSSSSKKSILPIPKISTPKIDFSMKTNQQKFLFFRVYGDRVRLRGALRAVGNVREAHDASFTGDGRHGKVLFPNQRNLCRVFFWLGRWENCRGVLVTKGDQVVLPIERYPYGILCVHLPQGASV